MWKTKISPGKVQHERGTERSAAAVRRLMGGKTKGGAKAPPCAGKKGRSIPRASTPLTEGPVTSDDIAGAFTRAIIPLPEQQILDRLARTFSVYKSYFLDAQKRRHLNSLSARAGDAIKTLREVLPPLLAHWGAIEAIDPQIVGHSKDGPIIQGRDGFSTLFVRAIQPMLEAAQNADLSRISYQDVVQDDLKDWRWFAGVIVQKVLPAFPPNTRTSKGGPVSRFLAEIIPLVSGDAPTATAIATQLQRRQTGEK